MSLTALVNATSALVQGFVDAVRPLEPPKEIVTLRGQQRILERAIRKNGSAWLVHNFDEIGNGLVPEWDIGQALRDYFKAAISEPIPADMLMMVNRIGRSGIATA